MNRLDQAKVGYDGPVLPIFFICKGYRPRKDGKSYRRVVPVFRDWVYIMPKAERASNG